MAPSQRARCGNQAARNAKWRLAAPPPLKCPGVAHQPWPIQPHPEGHVHRSHFPPPPPHLPLFHTRHAEESAERPHLVTVVRPCGQSTLRKVTVLLNRRGVVSYEQLLLDISEALGFPRWHRARVTRLYTTHAREVKGICDFFRGEVAFLALGKARPELSGVQEALEELFPDHSHYRADALRSWEKRLRPAPDKAAKADSGYSEGTDSGRTNQDTNTDVNNHNCAHTSPPTDKHQPENYNPVSQKPYKKNSSRKPDHLPNHLQRLRVRGGVRERPPSVIGPFKHEEGVRDTDTPSPILCENCLARRVNYQGLQAINALSGKVPLPPVSRKQKGSVEQEVKPLEVYDDPSPPQPISRDEGKNPVQGLNPAPGVALKHSDTQQRQTFDLPSGGSDVTLSDIERCYEFGRVVGDGNFAVVRECCRRDSGQTLAIKIIERSKLIGREHMMQNELSLLGSLCHPRIVRLLAHHHTHTHSYLVMELVSGGDLFEAISNKGKFTEAEAGLMVSDVSEALNYIHCKSIVHRDIKPENLLIEHVAAGICRLKLGDFGLAMVVTEPVFTICGTPTYVAPEILYETGYGVTVDVWALGVILYILLCGFPPFRSRDRDQEELFQLIKQGQLHFPSPYWDHISEEARRLVKALLQSDPSIRLTAEQTLLHPWVKAMASVCRQRALTDKTQSNTTDTGAEPESALRATESLTGKTVGSKGELTISRHNESQPDMSTAGAQDENKPIPQQSKETLHFVSPQIKEQLPLEHTSGHQKTESSPTEQHGKQEIQDQHPKLPECVETDQLASSTAQSEVPPQAQSNQNSQPPDPPSPANTVQQGHSIQHNSSSSNPATAPLPTENNLSHPKPPS